MDQAFIDLYDLYTHTLMERRIFLRRLAKLAGGTTAAVALLPLLENNYAKAAIIARNDARIMTSYVMYRGASGDVRAYLAKPKAASKGSGRRPAVIVIHENKGLHPHIEDVARRTAVAGFIALAPDLLSPLGGTPDNRDAARGMTRQLDRATTIRNLTAAVAYVKARSDVSGKIGCVGFCWGGGMTNQLAVHEPDLAAAVAFYGRTPRSRDVVKIKAKLLLHYAGLDKRINAGIPAYERALKKAGTAYAMHLYDGANHAFHNDLNAARYNREAAQLAWRRTITFFESALGGV